jgi:hypothetical protein
MLGLKEVKLSTISWGTGTQSNEGVTMSKFKKDLQQTEQQKYMANRYLTLAPQKWN